jgi:GT2 family glycosyltransferase
VIRQPNGGGASARNAGFRASTADVIAFTDCDCVADEDWIEALISALNGSGAAGVGAPIRTGTPRNWISRYWQSSGIYRQRVRKGQVDYLLTGNVAFRRSALLAVNGFEEHKGVWGEDPDLSYKLLEAGYALTVTARGIVWHYGDPTSIRGLARSVYRYGFGNVIRSKRWKGKRQPTVELLRHASAVVLSPLLALLYAQRAGKLMWVFPFMLFIIVEHSAFVAGMVSAMSSNGYRGNA